jgi:hypothetical protein
MNIKNENDNYNLNAVETSCNEVETFYETTNDEEIVTVAKRILTDYREAFEELAK